VTLGLWSAGELTRLVDLLEALFGANHATTTAPTTTRTFLSLRRRSLVLSAGDRSAGNKAERE